MVLIFENTGSCILGMCLIKAFKISAEVLKNILTLERTKDGNMAITAAKGGHIKCDSKTYKTSDISCPQICHLHFTNVIA